MELTQNNILRMWIGNLDRRIVWYHFHQSTVKVFGDRGKCRVLTLRGGEHHQDDAIIINQDFGVLVSTENPIRQRHVEFQKDPAIFVVGKGGTITNFSKNIQLLQL